MTTDGTVIDGAADHRATTRATARTTGSASRSPLPAGVTAADIDHFVFDAYDNDGIYVTAIGDAFIPIADGPNGAKLDYVRMGTKALRVYVDDGSSGCTNGTNSGGPGGTAYPCVGGQVDIAK